MKEKRSTKNFCASCEKLLVSESDIWSGECVVIKGLDEIYCSVECARHDNPDMKVMEFQHRTLKVLKKADRHE